MPRIILRILFSFLSIFFVSSLTGPSLGQPVTTQEFTLENIVIEGLQDETLEGLLKVSITPAVGSKISFEELEQVKLEVLQLGFFKSVSVELKIEGQNQLIIKVVPNPMIKSISFSGNTLIVSGELSHLIDERLNLVSGVILNNARLEEARQLIATAYRQGAPFSPKVDFSVGTEENGQVEVKFTIDETAQIKDVKVEGATIIKNEVLKEEFKPLLEKGKFDAETYVEAVGNVNRRYAQQGYRGSGVAIDQTQLVNGVLTIGIREFKIDSLDASNLGIQGDLNLSLKPGDFFNYNKLLADVQSLNKNQNKQVKLVVEQVTADSVAVTFVLEEAPAEPIQEIKIEGNSLVSDEELIKAMRQKLGDRFNTTLANEADFASIYDLYGDKGYLIVGQPDFTFKDGIYTIRLNEVRVVGYELNWRGNHRTQDFIITRELPEPGQLFNRANIAKGLGNLYRAGLLKSINPTIKVPNVDKPNEVIFVLNMEENQTLSLKPGISFSTLDGWAGVFGLDESNLFGLNHIVRLNAEGGQNDAGQHFQGSLSYTIPWLYIDFLDFKQVPTAISVFANSNVSPNRSLRDKDKEANSPEQPDRTFSIRSSGGGLSISRPILDNLNVSFGYSLQYEQSFLEHKANTTYKTSDAQALSLLPKPILTNFFELSGQFSTKNSVEFPTSGIVATASVGYGFGFGSANGIEASQSSSWLKTTAGFRTYLGFGWDNKGEFGLGPNRNLALALRLDAGAISTITGKTPASRQFSLGGAGNFEPSVLRGFDFNNLTGDYFFSGSLELRVDFGLKTAITNGLLGIVFLDFGNTWGNGTRFIDKTTLIKDGIQFGYGLGIQINLGIGAFQLPALRFDYGFSQYYPSGKFYFRFSLPF